MRSAPYPVKKVVSAGLWWRAAAHCASGVIGLWKGVGPNLQRAFIVNAAELSSYDHAKQLFLKHDLLEEGVLLHGIASFGAGLTAAIFSTPVDTIKTRLMQQPVGSDGKGKLYRGMLDCASQTVKGEGFMGLYRKFTKNIVFFPRPFIHTDIVQNACRWILSDLGMKSVYGATPCLQ